MGLHKSQNDVQNAQYLGIDHGCSQTQTIEFADRHAPFAPCPHGEAASGLPEMWHDEAVARGLSELRQLRWSYDRRNGIAGSGEHEAGS
jgi:hypothetical protein